MAANPMQKKVRNSFLLGMVITLIICALIAAVVYFVFFSDSAKAKSERGQKVTAYVLNRNVKSGQTITVDMLTPLEVYSNMIPANYINQTVLGQIVWQYGEPDNKKVLYTNEKEQTYMVIENGGEYYKTIENKANQVLVEKDDIGYYITKKTGNEKEYIKLDNVPVVAKINMSANSILTTDNISKSDQIITDDVRVVEYNMLTLPVDILTGDYIDIRITFPNGQDFVVASKKQIKSITGNTITFQMSEEEILMMNSAIVESYVMSASNLYVIRYVEPGLQHKAVNTYTPTAEVRALIETDSNIVETAKAKLLQRFNLSIRENMDMSHAQYNMEELDNIEAGIQKQIENAKKAREEYLQSLENADVNTNQ